MTTDELIALLQKHPGRLVVLAKDSEGNGFSPLADHWACAYRASTTWYGDAGFETLTKKDRDQGYDDDDLITDGVPALVLWPVN